MVAQSFGCRIVRPGAVVSAATVRCHYHRTSGDGPALAGFADGWVAAVAVGAVAAADAVVGDGLYLGCWANDLRAVDALYVVGDSGATNGQDATDGVLGAVC